MHNLNDALFSCLLAGEPALGKVYNISNGQPVPFWDAVNYVMRQLDLPPVGGHLPYAVGYIRRRSTKASAGSCQGARSRCCSAWAWR